MERDTRLLVTLCNMAEPKETALMAICVSTHAVTPVSLGAPILVKSCTGLAQENNRIYVLCQDSNYKSHIACLVKDDLSPVFFQALPEIADGHSLLVRQGYLYVVSTGSDALIKYRLSEAGVSEPEIVWRIKGSDKDTHHLNCVTTWNGEIVLSAFGRKTGQTWSTAVSGYIFNVTRQLVLAENIYQPHSLREWQGDLYYCESARGTVSSLQNRNIIIGDYTRGLDFISNDEFVVGSSIARKVSRSTGFINNPNDPGTTTGNCEIGYHKISNLPPTTSQIKVSLAAYGSEIYDLLYIGEMSATGPFRALIPADHSLTGKSQQSRPDQGQATSIEYHQALTEVQRLLELKQKELAELSPKYEVSQRQLAEFETRLAQKEFELSALRDEVQKLRIAFEGQQDAMQDRRFNFYRWIARVLGASK